VQGSRLRAQRAGQNLDYPDPKIASVVMTDKKLFFATLRGSTGFVVGNIQARKIPVRPAGFPFLLNFERPPQNVNEP